MSPLPLRRYRAERLLRREFEAMRGRVQATVRARLRAAGVSLDAGDLEACYSQAWHGLYATMLNGSTEIANPEGWLALVTYRRAIDEHRSHGARVAPVGDGSEPALSAGSSSSSSSSGSASAGAAPAAGMYSRRAPRARASHARATGPFDDAYERDLADELDDRVRLRQLLEGLRGRLGRRERQAAALCYLQGLSRADAAARMGISEARMRKLMDGSGAGAPGVASKVGELLNSIRAGSYCAEQSSLMRGFAFGILDPDGERYMLAVAHQRECPACRAHVLSLRGLAAVLPVPPLPLVLGASVAAGAGAGAGTGIGGASASAGMAGSAGAAAGVSTAGAGGGWLMAGGLGAKLAVGCLVAVSVGAGCVALTVGPIVPSHAPSRRHRRHVAYATSGRRAATSAYQVLSSAPAGAQLASGAEPVSRAGASKPTAAAASKLTPAARASREFGLEQPAGRASAGHVSTGSEPSVARVASSAGSGSSVPQARPASNGHESGGPSAAAREFGLG